MSDFCLVIIDKRSKISLGLMEKRLELVPRNQNQTFIFYFPFILLPTEVDTVSQKRGCKRNLVRSGGSADSKMVFALLTEVITFYVKSTAVTFRVLALNLSPDPLFDT